MRNSTKLLVRRGIAIVNCVALISFALPVNGIKCANAVSKKNYVIVTKTSKGLNDLEDDVIPTNSLSERSEDSMRDGNICTAQLTAQQVNNLKEQDAIVSVEEDKSITAFSNGHYKNREINRIKEKEKVSWNREMVKIPKKKTTVKDRIKVAVIDSGVDNLNDITLSESINLVPDEEEVLPLFWDVTGHGSAVAGIIAAEDNETGITGINPDVDIMSIKVLDSANSAPISRVVEGIYWAIENGANIINMSFGTSTDSVALKKAIDDADKAGILMVAAAGNNESEGVQYPAAYDGVISVGSVGLDSKHSEFSAVGENLDLVAPGESITTTSFFDGTVVSSGTSLSAPHVSAAASIIWQLDKSMPKEFITQLLEESANQYGDKENYGNGIVDIDYALENYKHAKNKFVTKSKDDVNESIELGIEENARDLYAYSSVNKVEGLWLNEGHEGTLPIQNMNYLKLGITYPDSELSGLKGMEKHPQWHGYYTSINGDDVNYVSRYLYLTRYALYKKMGNQGIYTPMTNDCSYNNGMSTYLEGMDWQYILMTDDTFEHRSAFILGMAMHAVGDIFAHSVWGYNSAISGFERIKHNYDFKEKKKESQPKNADDPEVCNGRYIAAKRNTAKILERWLSNDKSYVDDFTVGGSPGAGKEWKLRNLSTYLRREGATVSHCEHTISLTSNPETISYK